MDVIFASCRFALQFPISLVVDMFVANGLEHWELMEVLGVFLPRSRAVQVDKLEPDRIEVTARPKLVTGKRMEQNVDGKTLILRRN